MAASKSGWMSTTSSCVQGRNRCAICIHGKEGGAGRKERAERAWAEYLTMPDRIHEWGLEALAAE